MFNATAVNLEAMKMSHAAVQYQTRRPADIMHHFTELSKRPQHLRKTGLWQHSILLIHTHRSTCTAAIWHWITKHDRLIWKAWLLTLRSSIFSFQIQHANTKTRHNSLPNYATTCVTERARASQSYSCPGRILLIGKDPARCVTVGQGSTCIDLVWWEHN